MPPENITYIENFIMTTIIWRFLPTRVQNSSKKNIKIGYKSHLDINIGFTIEGGHNILKLLIYALKKSNKTEDFVAQSFYNNVMYPF